MAVSSIHTFLVTPQGATLTSIEAIYQKRRIPQLTLSGLPESCARQLKQKLDVLVFEFIGPLKGRVHLHFSTYKPNSQISICEFACLLVILASEREKPGGDVLALGEINLNGTLTLPKNSERVIRTELNNNSSRADSKIWITPSPFDQRREIPLKFLQRESILNSLLQLMELKAEHSAAQEVALQGMKGQAWFESLPHTQRSLALLAAAGWHSLLLVGPPGCGKSYFSHGLLGLLMDVARIENPSRRCPLLIQPNTQVSPEHLVYGFQSKNAPSCWDEAAHGILWLDELSEYRRHTLESLRSPMDDFRQDSPRLILATCNPCPCGYFNDNGFMCHCPTGQRRAVIQKLSGPFLERFSIGFSPTHKLPIQWISSESYADTIQRIAHARQRLSELHGDFHVGSQWVSSGTILSVAALLPGIERFRERLPAMSRRRQIQVLRRALTLHALGCPLSGEHLLEETLWWDCQNLVNAWWDGAPALSVASTQSRPISATAVTAHAP